MNENEKALPEAGLAKPTPNAAEAEKKVFLSDGKERWCLALAFGFCVLFVDMMLSAPPVWLGLEATVTVAVWYGLVLAYAGKQVLARRENRFLLAVNLLLALSLSLGSNEYFHLWNWGALLVLVPLHAVTLSGAAALPWWRPLMLWERLRLLGQGLFGNLGATAQTLGATEEGKGKKLLSVGLGLAAVAGLLAVLVPMLASADALFGLATESVRTFFQLHLSELLWKALVGLVLTPFFFGLVYSIRRARPLQTPPVGRKAGTGLEAVTGVLILVALDVLYALFLAVQSAGLFGGAAYLEARGISYADWAREGFFQLVFVTVLNLAVVMAVLCWSRSVDKKLRWLATVLVGESLVLLCSAAWRMSLYVAEYGLSFKRCMTYWGMGVMAVLLAAAALKIWRKEFAFCRVAFLTAVCAWVAVSFVPVDYLVAQDLVSRYLDGRNEIVSVYYLTEQLSFDTLGPLERLDQSVPAHGYTPEWYPGGETLGQVLAGRRTDAVVRCQSWRMWTLSAYLAGRG